MDDGGPDDASAWELTIAEMNELADELTAEGWEVVATRAGHVAPEPPDAGESDRFGLVFVVPGDDEAAFREAFETGEFTEYRVYRRRLGDQLFLVVQYADPDRELAILIAGGVDLAEADDLLAAVREREAMYTHVQLLDWTHLGSFRHDDYAAFFEDP